MSLHATARAKERLGLDLTPQDFEHMLAEIKAGRSVLLANLDPGVERHLVQHGGQALIVVCRPSNQVILTVLPRQFQGRKQINPGVSRRLRNR